MDHRSLLPYLQRSRPSRSLLPPRPSQQREAISMGRGNDPRRSGDLLGNGVWAGAGEGEGREGIWAFDTCWRDGDDCWVCRTIEL